MAAHPDEFTLIGCHDSDPATLAKALEKWPPLVPGLQAFKRSEDLLDQQLDAVAIEGRVYENLRYAELALQSGRPVLLEKPPGDNFEQYRRVIELAQRKNLHVQLIYLFRYMSAVQELLRRVRDGSLGEVYEFRGRLPKDLDSYDHYVADLGRYRGGIFFEMAGHLVDMMVAILGPPKSVTPFLAHHHRQPGDFIDNGVAVFGFDRSWGIIEVAALEVVPHSRRIEVYGTRGACVIPHLGSGHLANRDVQPIEVFEAGPSQWERLELPAATLQIRDLREFAAVITGQKAPDFSMQHDLAVQEALLKASGML
jgi:predicted dehydrogenase